MWRVTCLRTANRGHPKNGSCRLVPSSQLIFGARPEPQDVYVMKFLLRFLQLCLKHNHHCVRLKLDLPRAVRWGSNPFRQSLWQFFLLVVRARPAPHAPRDRAAVSHPHINHMASKHGSFPHCVFTFSLSLLVSNFPHSHSHSHSRFLVFVSLRRRHFAYVAIRRLPEPPSAHCPCKVPVSC